MGDGRYDSAAPGQGGRAAIRSSHVCCSTWRPSRARAGAIDQRGDARRDRRQRAPADSGRGVRGRDPRRRQGGREQPARLPRRPRGRARHGCRAARPALRQARQRRALADRLRELERESMSVPAAARAFIGEGVRRLVAYQDVAYARLYLDRLEPIRARRRARQRGRQTAAPRPRGISRCACLRGRDPRRPGQDRAGALRRIEARSAPSRRALRRSRNSSSPASRNCARSCRRGWRARSSRSPKRGWLGTLIAAWRSTPRRSRAICASGCSRSCGRFRPRSWRYRRGAARRSRLGSA